ncbi:MAG: amidohydrolase [Oscillospiraceae bacterium]|nr:amidohydrolase [Oscillospiraceae bacterium]
MRILIDNVTAICPDGVRVCGILTEDDKISAVCKSSEGQKTDKTIDGTGKLAVPGFVNAHTHAYMTLFRNLADDCDFNTWLFKKIAPLEDAMTAEEAYWGSLCACMEMVESGCTFFSDMHMFPGAGVKAAAEIGMRAVISRGLAGGKDDREGAARRLREAEDEIAEYSQLPNISFMLAPHAPYTCDEAYLREIAEKAEELGLGIHTHLAESRWETERVAQLYGCTPTEFFDRCGILTPNTVAAHCVYLTQSDIKLIAEREVSVAVNSASNLKLGNGIAPVPELMKKGVNICLGTDSAASNNSLSILRELQLLTLLHKGAKEDPCLINAREGFKAAAENGAAALGARGVTGRIEAGYKADIAIFDLEQPCLTPLGDPFAALCYSSAGMRADTVLIDGKIVYDAGEFTQIDRERVYRRVKEITQKMKQGGEGIV